MAVWRGNGVPQARISSGLFASAVIVPKGSGHASACRHLRFTERRTMAPSNVIALIQTRLWLIEQTSHRRVAPTAQAVTVRTVLAIDSA
jgi:hypothetical protein